MKGIVFAWLAGAFITLQGVANARISSEIGTWQAATLTQCTGFAAALLLCLFARDAQWRSLKQVKPMYAFGGALAAIIIFSNVEAIRSVGVTFTISAVLIAQLCLTFLVDGNGWFGVPKRKLRLPHALGIGLMAIGIVVLAL
ncbi:DMT family transporter [Paenibacillus sp. TRM 82003]|nr:DMT family transporter [Paenibacillus sp. TRM 82003]